MLTFRFHAQNPIKCHYLYACLYVQKIIHSGHRVNQSVSCTSLQGLQNDVHHETDVMSSEKVGSIFISCKLLHNKPHNTFTRIASLDG